MRRRRATRLQQNSSFLVGIDVVREREEIFSSYIHPAVLRHCLTTYKDRKTESATKAHAWMASDTKEGNLYGVNMAGRCFEN